MEFYFDLYNLCLSHVGGAKCGSPKVMEFKLKATLRTHSVQQQRTKSKNKEKSSWKLSGWAASSWAPKRIVGKVLTLSGWLCFWWLLSARHVTAGLKRPPASAGAGSHQLTQPTHWQPHTQGAATSQDDTRVQAAVGRAGPGRAPQSPLVSASLASSEGFGVFESCGISAHGRWKNRWLFKIVDHNSLTDVHES